jgi:Iron/manganese superoxide dismutases, alpha-hairpin domain
MTYSSGSCALKVTGFTLVDANLRSDIMALGSFSIGDLPALLSIRADVSSCRPKVVKSVLVEYDGNSRCETNTPYTSFGDPSTTDLANNKGKYRGRVISPGNHTIKATPYDGEKCTGVVGKPLRQTFTAKVASVPVVAPVQAPVMVPVVAPVHPPRRPPVLPNTPTATPPVSAPAVVPVTVPAPVKAPIAAPVKVPVTAPVKAPVTAPVKAPVTAPVKAPVIAPVTTPVTAPILAGYRLPELLYPAEALEPYIDETTMMIHHDKHHATYVANLNKATEGKETVPVLDLMKNALDVTAIRNNGGGHYNHAFFLG